LENKKWGRWELHVETIEEEEDGGMPAGTLSLDIRGDESRGEEGGFYFSDVSTEQSRLSYLLSYGRLSWITKQDLCDLAWAYSDLLKEGILSSSGRLPQERYEVHILETKAAREELKHGILL